MCAVCTYVSRKTTVNAWCIHLGIISIVDIVPACRDNLSMRGLLEWVFTECACRPGLCLPLFLPSPLIVQPDAWPQSQSSCPYCSRTTSQDSHQQALGRWPYSGALTMPILPANSTVSEPWLDPYRSTTQHWFTGNRSRH